MGNEKCHRFFSLYFYSQIVSVVESPVSRLLLKLRIYSRLAQFIRLISSKFNLFPRDWREGNRPMSIELV